MMKFFSQFVPKKCPHPKQGESLVEVIMAIFVVTIGASVATTLIISALQSNDFSRDNLIALNLATEGLEAMRAIRDANWLKFSDDKADCWNMLPGTTACSSSSGTAITSGNYAVDLNLDPNAYQWNLTSITGGVLDLTPSGSPSTNGYYQLYYFTFGSSATGCPTVGSMTGCTLIASKNSSGTGFIKQTSPLPPFYRMIHVDYPSPPSCTAAPACDEMDVTSTVQWSSQGEVHQVVLQTILTNYQKVKVKT